MAEEVFEHGTMFWWCEDQCETDQPVGQIVVLFDDGHRWELHPDKWKESDPEYSCPEATPADCPPTPKRGFGLVWCGLEEKIRDELGKVTECEKAYTGSMQQFERGFMLLFDDGTIYEFGGEGSGEWTAIEPTDTPTRTPAPTPTDTLTPTPIPTDTPELYFSEDFSEQALGNSWRVSGPRVGVSNGVLRLEGDDTEYPLVSTVQSPFPERGGFRVDVRFRYATVSNWGAGFAAAEDVPSRGTDVNVQHRFLGVWQDRNELLRMFTHGVTMYAAPEPDTSWHIIELEYKANWYELTLDDIPVYSSQAAIDRPTALWFGNTAEVQGEGTWPVMEVDYVHIRSTD
jgi:hypothetical protein